MNRTSPISPAFRLLLIVGLVAVSLFGAAGPQIPSAFAQENDNDGMQPLDEDGGSLYYYLDGQRINLTPSLDWVSVKFISADENEQEAATGKFSNTVTTLEGARSVPHLGLTLLPVNDGLNPKTFVQGVNAMRSDPGSFSQVNPVYSFGNVDMVVSDEFVAAFRPETSVAEIEAFNEARGVELVSPIIGQPNTFVLRITSESSLDALGTANDYHESGFVLFAAPNFVRLVTGDETSSQKPASVGPMFTPDDTYYVSDQWHLNNTSQFGGTPDADIDAPEAWDVTQGSASVTIAVIDEGVDLTHADLAGNMLAGYDATGLGSAGAPSGDDAHGTAVAGLAAAVTNNTLGVAGVCPLCTILPVRIAYGDGLGGWVYTDVWAANGIGWAYTNGADVLNNSWGGGAGATVVNTAITNAVTNGRGGLGSVVVFSAGNDNASTVSWPASQSNVIAVGASNQCDQRKTPTNNVCNGFEDLWGSNYGSALDVVAPGVWLTTTDITGTAGYNDGTDPDYTEDYDGYMNGTSGAAPIVSGVLGLMMTINPYMPPDGLQDILEQTADDVNTAGWDNETGYGRVNAYQAVLLAEKPDLVVTSYELRDGPHPTGALISQVNPDETFWIWITMENQGGSASGNFYPGVFLDDKPNYGGDHDSAGVTIPGYPVTLTLGEVTDYQGYRITPSGALSGAGCMYYDPTDLVNPLSSEVVMERSNYTVQSILPSLPAGSNTTVSVEISYPIAQFPDSIYDNDNVRTGLKAGSYNIYLYADPNCAGGDEESFETNNDYGPFNLSVGGSLPSGPTNIDITIGGVSRGSYYKEPGQSDVVKYNLDGGPVVISSDNGVGIIASLNQWRRRPSTTVGWTGVSQSMALPVSLITNTYYFPRYDYSNSGSLYNAILLANVDTVSRDITVTIGGIVRGTYTLDPSASQFVTYPGLVGGPIVVSSATGAQIVASLYELIRDPSAAGWNGQSEMMGLPATQLTDEYLIPIYYGAANPNTLNASLHIANVDSVTTTVQVTIAGVPRGTYVMNPATSIVVKYSVDGGPVVISSNNNANIVASLNQWRRRPSTTVGWTGVSQSMALPVSLITNQYVLPRYDYSNTTSLYNAVLLANVDSVSRNITVMIGGVVRGTYAIAPSQSQFVTYPGVVDGPVIVSSDVGARIVASLYELIRDPSAAGWNGQSEMMGLPFTQLSDQYLIPLYFGAANPNTLNASLYIAVP